MTAERLAKIISWILNPLIMPTIGLLLIFYSNTYLSLIPVDGKKVIFTIFFIGTFLVPISFLPVFYYLRLIREIEMSSTERIFPLFVTAIVYFFAFYLLRSIPIPFITGFLFATALSVLLSAVISLFWKISSHLIGIGGLTGLIYALFYRYNADIRIILLIVILAAGLVGFARLQLEKHTPAQVYTGYLLGLVVVGITLLFV
jgi:membrane-associated phospholipid phosphatase